MTTLVLIGLCFGLIAFDVWLYFKRPDETISNVLHRGSLKYPVIPFLAGLICGHFFWP